MKSKEFWEWFDGHCAPRLRASTTPGQARDATFRKMFEHLDGFDRPVVIVETGCIEEEDNWVGNGMSTLMFDRYVATHPGSTLDSVDYSPEHVVIARELCRSAGTMIFRDDSVEFLEGWKNRREVWNIANSIDLLYLDASHLDWNNETPAANHHLNELYAIMPALRDDTLVVVDDSPSLVDDYPRIFVGGKGAFVAKHAFAVGAELVFHEYQIGFTKITNRPVPSTTDIRELVRRAREHQDAGRLAAADEIYRVVLAICGKNPVGNLERKSRAEACTFYAFNASDKGKLGTAVDWHRDAVVADPGWIDHRLALVRSSYRFGLWEAARAEAERATRIKPDDHLAWKSLGDMELELEHADAAKAAYDREMELAPPGYLDALLDRCAVAIDTEDYGTADALCARMMGTSNEKDAWHCMGMLAYRRGQHERAIECYDNAIAMRARDQAQVHWNKSLALHSIGRYREGWQEHEWRAYATNNKALSMPLRRFNLPKWNGQKPPALIHVHGEAGAGDNISCARYFQLMLRDGYQVRYECLSTMEKMFADSFPDVEVVERAKDYPGTFGLQPFDYHCPIGSLPAIYKTDLDTVPWLGPYIKADIELRVAFERQLHVAAEYPRIGLCWSSGIRLDEGIWMKKYGLHKSTHFDVFAEHLIAKVPDAVYVNLQVGPERAQSRNAIFDVLPDKPSWAETAALIENLDVVVTVDTGIAHLAGAMGKPVLLAMHPQGSWHFMVHREGASFDRFSPWYPSTLVYRPEVFGGWPGVLKEIARDLNSQEWRDKLLSWPWNREERAAAE